MLPLLPASISNYNPHVYMCAGREGEPPESMSTFQMLADTGAQCNTMRLKDALKYILRKPHHVKAVIDSRDGVYAPIPLYGMIGDNPVRDQMSTSLPVLIVLYTPYSFWETQKPFYLSLLCGNQVSVRGVVGIPFFVQTGRQRGLASEVSAQLLAHAGVFGAAHRALSQPVARQWLQRSWAAGYQKWCWYHHHTCRLQCS